MANSYYLQSAFWGGKTKHILPALRELKRRVDIDIAANYFSSIIQDERYVNWYFWKQMNNSNVNIRWLGPSYLYPFRSKGFGHWVMNASRPIIIHGTAKAGKMIIGEHEIKVAGAGGKKGTCFDTFLGNKIGTYACHDPEYRGGTQGFVWLKERLRTTETIKLCVDANNLKAGDPVLMKKCIDGDKGQKWRWDDANGWFVSQLTGLCLDSYVLPVVFCGVVGLWGCWIRWLLRNARTVLFAATAPHQCFPESDFFVVCFLFPSFAFLLCFRNSMRFDPELYPESKRNNKVRVLVCL